MIKWGPDKIFNDYLARGIFMIQRSRSTGEYVFYPRTIMPGSGLDDLEWVAPSGNGTVYATSVVRHRPDSGGTYNVALIDLVEGPRLISRVDGIAPEDVVIGMAVTAEIDNSGTTPLLVFFPRKQGRDPGNG